MMVVVKWMEEPQLGESGIMVIHHWEGGINPNLFPDIALRCGHHDPAVKYSRLQILEGKNDVMLKKWSLLKLQEFV